MKKSIIKVLTVLMTAVMAFTFSCVSASAADKFLIKGCTTISSGKTYKTFLRNKHAGYKFTAAKAGELKVTVSTDYEVYVMVYTDKGVAVSPVIKSVKGSKNEYGVDEETILNSGKLVTGFALVSSGNNSCTASYFITAGTYYIMLYSSDYYYREGNHGLDTTGSTTKFTATFPTSKSSTDKFKELKSGKAVKFTIQDLDAGRTTYIRKITSKVAGKLKLGLKTEMGSASVGVYDEQGNPVLCTEKSIKTAAIVGTDLIYCYGTSGTPCDGTVTYEIGKGTYYLVIVLYGWDEKPLTVTSTITQDSSADKNAYITYTLKKGSSVQLGADMSSGSAKDITWSSSNRNAVKVSADGKATAIAKGTAYITAKTDNSSTRIKIIVE